jgi:DNA-binding NarL/FixJ family response regulator
MYKIKMLYNLVNFITINKLTTFNSENYSMGHAPGMKLLRRHLAIGMLNAGMTMREVARQFHVSKSTISCLKT